MFSLCSDVSLCDNACSGFLKKSNTRNIFNYSVEEYLDFLYIFSNRNLLFNQIKLCTDNLYTVQTIYKSNPEFVNASHAGRRTNGIPKQIVDRTITTYKTQAERIIIINRWMTTTFQSYDITSKQSRYYQYFTSTDPKYEKFKTLWDELIKTFLLSSGSDKVCCDKLSSYSTEAIIYIETYMTDKIKPFIDTIKNQLLSYKNSLDNKFKSFQETIYVKNEELNTLSLEQNRITLSINDLLQKITLKLSLDQLNTIKSEHDVSLSNLIKESDNIEMQRNNLREQQITLENFKSDVLLKKTEVSSTLTSLNIALNSLKLDFEPVKELPSDVENLLVKCDLYLNDFNDQIVKCNQIYDFIRDKYYKLNSLLESLKNEITILQKIEILKKELNDKLNQIEEVTKIIKEIKNNITQTIEEKNKYSKI